MQRDRGFESLQPLPRKGLHVQDFFVLAVEQCVCVTGQ
jgi:hypothetical protein